MTCNPGTLNAYQVANLLSFLSDEAKIGQNLETLQTKFMEAFLPVDAMKVNFAIKSQF